MRILIVEDEDSLSAGLEFNFKVEGYDVVICRDGPSALTTFEKANPRFDIVVLDLMLPGMSGYEVCKNIRKSDKDVPIMVLSARSLSEDKAYAFDCGCDQYVTKPFALPELLSRIRRLGERRQLTTKEVAGERTPEPPLTPLSTSQEYAFGNVRVDFRTFQLHVGEKLYALTTMELQLLKYFIEHEGSVLSRTQILEEVWGFNAAVTTRTIDNFVLRLRKFIEMDPSQPRYLLSIRGTGYRFLANPEAVTS